MDLSKLINLVAEVAVRRTVQKEAEEKTEPQAVRRTVLSMFGALQPFRLHSTLFSGRKPLPLTLTA